MPELTDMFDEIQNKLDKSRTAILKNVRNHIERGNINIALALIDELIESMERTSS